MLQANTKAHWDVAIAGAGSGGIGAAIAAARLGMKTLLVEKAGAIGGTAVRAGVHTWEPGAGGTGVPFDIYLELKNIPGATGIYSIGRHCCWPEPGRQPFPGGEGIITPAGRYADTLRRHGAKSLREDEAFCRAHWRGVVFDPGPYVSIVKQMLEETGRCEIMTGSELTGLECAGGTLAAARISGGRRITADAWIDCTADGSLCMACGAEAAPRGNAPLNGVSLIYRISRSSSGPAPNAAPETLPHCWWAPRFPVVACAQCPNGDRLCNMLPTMSGEEYLALGERAALEECRSRVHAHWQWLRVNFREFRDHSISWIAPELGVRERRRILCEYMLGGGDLAAGLAAQNRNDIVAIADHAMDRHGEGGGCVELAAPYGIPFQCLVPKGLQNVLVASMAAGFTPEAASSCRLSRTVMQLGQAAGTAAALAKQLGVQPRDVPAVRLQEQLRRDHVQLEWPISESIARRLAKES